MLILLYPFLPSISQQMNIKDGASTIINEDVKIILIIVFITLIAILLILRMLRYLFYFDYRSKKSSLHSLFLFPSVIILFICLIPTEEDIMIDTKEEIMTKHASTIDTTISQWLYENNIPQYKLCNEKAIYTRGEGLKMARYKTGDTLLCGGMLPVEDFKILNKSITIEIQDDGIYGSIN